VFQRYIDLLDWSDTDWYVAPQVGEMEEAETWAAIQRAAQQQIFDAKYNF